MQYCEAEMNCAARLCAASCNAIEQLLPGADDHLGGGRGRGGAQVGDEIGDADIGFVPDSRDNGDRGIGDGVSDGFFVEGPQVFERTSAAGNYGELGPTG